MQLKSKLSILLVFTGSICALAQDMAGFKWLSGTWKQKDKNAFEIWVDKGDFLEGKSFFIRNSADTAVTESIKLLFKDGSYFYVPDVSGPQDEVFFKITVKDESSFLASNPDHDFPKAISYRATSPTTMEATIEGNSKKKTYYFERLP